MRKIENWWEHIISRSTVSQSGCWLWNGAINSSGYPSIKVNGVTSAHRLMFMLANPNLKIEHLHVLHRCDIRHCVNPSHMYAGSNSDNVRDRVNRRRANPLKGQNNPRSKLTNERVGFIKSLHAEGFTYASLAEFYGVHRSLIRRIVLGGCWRHL